jgi:DNA-directed RNA polymerase specialized sigma24 family protein
MSRLPDLQEMQAFAKRAGCDVASAYLALPKIAEHKLTIDHPRAAKLARGQANRSARAEWSCALTMPESDGRAGTVDADTPLCAERGAMQVDESQIAPRFRDREKKEDKRWPMALVHSDARLTTYAPGQIDEESEIEARIKRALHLKYQVEPRDREVLELRFERGLKIAEIAEKTGKTRAAIYKSLDRMKPLLYDARERSDWEDEHNGLRIGTGDAPVVLHKNQQLGWDLGVQP